MRSDVSNRRSRAALLGAVCGLCLLLQGCFLWRRGGDPEEEVTLCHMGVKTIAVEPIMVAVHKNHGDTEGACAGGAAHDGGAAAEGGGSAGRTPGD